MYVFKYDEPFQCMGRRCATFAVNLSTRCRVITKRSNRVSMIRLYATQAPRTVEHFKKLVAFEYYVGGSFYRVECDYLIQGGGVS